METSLYVYGVGKIPVTLILHSKQHHSTAALLVHEPVFRQRPEVRKSATHHAERMYMRYNTPSVLCVLSGAKQLR